MFWIGMVVAVIISIIFAFIYSPLVIVVLVLVAFGMIFSTHQRSIQIENDLKDIRKKLGLLRPDEVVDLYTKPTEEPENIPVELSEINKKIEQELEQYIEDDEHRDKKD